MSNLRHLPYNELVLEARRSTAFIERQQRTIKEAQSYIAGEAERLKWIQHYINTRSSLEKSTT